MEYGIGGLVLFLLIAAGILVFNKKHKRKTTYDLKMRVGSDVGVVQTKSVTPGMAVVVTFNEIMLKHSEEGTPIVKTFEGGKEINLLDEGQKGASLLAEFGEEELRAGRYEWIRLMVDLDKCFVSKDGEKFPIDIPSGAQTGLKLVRGFWVHGIGVSDFTIDFSVRKNLTRMSDGTYKLKPTLKLIDNTGREEDTPIPPELDPDAE
jgi:hypothetical protein